MVLYSISRMISAYCAGNDVEESDRNVIDGIVMEFSRNN
jgi:hypothetical protein